MDKVLAQALELTAEEVAAAPLLGYRIEDLEQRVQPWIKIVDSTVNIDIEGFWRDRPLDGLLVESETFVIPSLVKALDDFKGRWAVSAQVQEWVGSSSPIEALFIDGGDAEALVWRGGMVIGAREPLATTLRLLFANFSEEARKAYVYASPGLLKSALSLLPDDVKSTHVPGASSFYAQACHELADQRQRKLNQMAPKCEWGPDGRLKLIWPPRVTPTDAPSAEHDQAARTD